MVHVYSEANRVYQFRDVCGKSGYEQQLQVTNLFTYLFYYLINLTNFIYLLFYYLINLTNFN